jgi:hypothetical protein
MQIFEKKNRSDGIMITGGIYSMYRRSRFFRRSSQLSSENGGSNVIRIPVLYIDSAECIFDRIDLFDGSILFVPNHCKGGHDG